ncbi:MAG: CvpA family protein [Clostridia bacterium]|nr:CvpA family protein [Clostridia bacterium]
MDIIQIINIAILATFGVVALIGFIRGIFKGTFRSLSDIALILINAVASTFISRAIAKAILNVDSVAEALVELENTFNNESYSAFLDSIEPYIEQGSIIREWDWGFILALPAVILTPIIFMLVFFLMGFVFKIVKLILQKLLIPKTKNGGLRVLGGVLGAVRSVLALAIFLVPIIGYANFALATVGDVEEATQEQILGESEDEIVDAVMSNTAIDVIKKCGGVWFFGELSTVYVEDVKVSLTEEKDHILEIYGNVPQLMELGEVGLESWGEEQVQLIDSTIASLEKSEYLTSLIASIMSQASSQLENGGDIYGFKLPYFGKTLDPVVQKLLSVWTTTDGKGLSNDLHTYSGIFAHLVEMELFAKTANFEELMALLENGEFYSGILIPLHENERTKPVVPTVADALQSYLYEIYERVNGEPYPGEITKVSMDDVNSANMNDEAEKIAEAIKEIHNFVNTAQGIENLEELVKRGDFGALGKGLNHIRDSVFFSNAYHFMLDTLLHSQMCADLGIFDSNFIENATRPDADMEQLLLSRQNIAILTMAMWDKDAEAQKGALKVLIEQVAQDDSEALKELVSVENLGIYGIEGEEAGNISGIVNSLVDTIHTHKFSSENEMHTEAEKTAEIIATLNGTHIDDDSLENAFGEGNSKTGVKTDDFVNDILDSQIAKEMIRSAVTSGEEDPYNLDGYLSDSDISSMTSSLSAKYAEAETQAEKQAILDIASIFSIDHSSVQ